MESAVVFVFLLDNLPGFSDVLNKTLQESKLETSTVKACNDFAIQAILKSLHREFDLNTRPNLKDDDIKPNQDLSVETLSNLGKVFDPSLTESGIDTYGIPNNHINKDLTSEEHRDFIDEIIKEWEVAANVTNRFPESAPLLVAIFESLSNVTAQTCAGALVSPHWVLTAASCVNFLGAFYKNVTSKSIYTVVVNATDPLIDGTAYNVTTVLLHPEYKYSRLKRLTPMIAPVAAETAHLALMRIEPGVEGLKEVVLDDVGVKGDVMVYAWMLVKNGTGNNTMHITNMPAKTVPCEDEYRPVLCLSSNASGENFNQMSSGGPILTIINNEVRMVAVTQSDDRSVVGYPLYKHYKWIQNVLKSK